MEQCSWWTYIITLNFRTVYKLMYAKSKIAGNNLYALEPIKKDSVVLAPGDVLRIKIAGEESLLNYVRWV